MTVDSIDVVSVTAGAEEITVTWNNPADYSARSSADYSTRNYNVYYGRHKVTKGSPHKSVWRGKKSYTIRNLAPNEGWCFGVTQRKDEIGESAFGKTLCATPTSLTAGCTDPDATNYDATAQTDDGSCTTGGGGGGSFSCNGSTAPSTLVSFGGGSFTMGDDTDASTDNPQHTVTLSGFKIENTEVTQAQYQAVKGSNPSNFSGSCLPVEQVTWQEATDYCTAIGRRLPTEAEWEYASRNGGTAPVNAYATGSTTAPTCSTVNAWIAGGGGACVGQTSNVGSYSASSSGLYDMAGNVWEWTGDLYSSSYYANGQTNPTGPGSGTNRVVRGGSWNGTVGGYFVDLRASFRGYSAPSNRTVILGFRCASN